MIVERMRLPFMSGRRLISQERCFFEGLTREALARSRNG